MALIMSAFPCKTGQLDTGSIWSPDASSKCGDPCSLVSDQRITTCPYSYLGQVAMETDFHLGRDQWTTGQHRNLQNSCSLQALFSPCYWFLGVWGGYFHFVSHTCNSSNFPWKSQIPFFLEYFPT